jgi:iron complex outermembrane receptor protein
MDGENGKTFLVQLARGPWSFDLNYGDRRKGDPTSTFISDPLAQGQYQQDRKLNTQLQYQDYLDNTLQLTGRLYMGQERYFGWYSNSGVWSLSSGSGDWRGGEFRLLSTRWDNHKVLLGLEYQDNSRQDQALEYPAIPANNTYIPGSGWRWGVYVQDEWVISKTLSSTLGVRVDDNNMTGKSLSPRAGLVWHVAPETILKALYGQAYRAPNVYERNYGDGVTQVANPGLIGEKINTLEFGIDQRVGHNMSLHGSIYQWHMDHLITLDEDPVSGLPQYQNTGNATALGLELSANKSWDSGSRLSGSIAFQKSHYNSGGDVPNSPHMMDKLNFSSPLTATGFLLGSEVQYYSRRETDINGKYVGGYTLFNLNLIADKWVKQMEVSLGFYNLFDKHYSLPAADFNWQNTLEQDGRQIRLKAVYTF